MTAQLVGFVTRAEAGLRPPRSFSRNITPDQGGVALHYGGPAQRITDHAGCLRTWRAYQRYHMDTHGWVDIAYSLGVCDHGYVLAGRGAGVRTAANGTNTGNDDYYAVVWLGGEGETPTQAALDAAEWAVGELRRAGRAGGQVLPHHVFTGTRCPGPDMTAQAHRLDGKPVSTATKPPATAAPKPKPAPKPGPAVPAYPGVTREGMRNSPVTRAYQQRLKDRGWAVAVDGDHGPGTTKVLKAFQQEKGLRPVDGIGGQNTWRALWAKPVTR